ncbi:copper resistance protein B [Candidatus Rariloculus sp.]|uniref:copper resistance protein B n=1 Tax=Candidatus Rariloculus sp. TaxID=3101265 RepID=UPI003D1002AF
MTQLGRAFGLLLAVPLWASAQDGPQLMDNRVFYRVVFDELEIASSGEEERIAWDGQAWVGTDTRRLWIKTEGERISGDRDEAEMQLLYSHAIAPYWDLQAGFRHDFDALPGGDWAVLSIQGLAPYFFEVEGELFIGQGGQAGLRFEAHYELPITQRLMLTPNIELNAFREDDRQRSIGSGLSELDLGVRLRYEIRREFAPYIGLRWIRKFGTTAEFSNLAGEDEREVELLAGFRFWF